MYTVLLVVIGLLVVASAIFAGYKWKDDRGLAIWAGFVSLVLAFEFAMLAATVVAAGYLPDAGYNYGILTTGQSYEVLGEQVPMADGSYAVFIEGSNGKVRVYRPTEKLPKCFVYTPDNRLQRFTKVDCPR